MKKVHNRWKIVMMITLFGLINLACGPNFLAQVKPTATATKTPKPPATDTPEPTLVVLATATPIPTMTPVPATATPMPPTDTPTLAPTVEATVAETAISTDTPTVEATEVEAASVPTDTPMPPTDTPAPTATSAPAVAYKIVHYKLLGEGENNGGVFNKGGQHMIFLTVLDAAGNGIDGAVVKDQNGSALEVVTGSKGPGKAEIEMLFEPFKLYVAADPSGPTTSEVSNAMNTAYPHLPDVVGKLGGLDNENSVCPTLEIRCSPPFYNVHFSYEITFQKVQ